MFTLLLYLWFLGTGGLEFSPWLAFGFALFDIVVLAVIFDPE